ncbi:MAG: hypothetical protein HC810_08135, partial [Acaryochloridaceae cyanobacterium RL_2_7]|nr:hypothetical protein [Acaryochloridaceae cyanobacterium RL_2_7]
MKTCLACETPIEKLYIKLGYCQNCLTEGVQIQSLCMNCASPLESSSPRCPNCGHRHGMASCDRCGDPLFKHSSLEVAQSLWRNFPSHGSPVKRLVRWLGQPKKTEVFYFHPHCLHNVTEQYEGRLTIAEPDFEHVKLFTEADIREERSKNKTLVSSLSFFEEESILNGIATNSTSYHPSSTAVLDAAQLLAESEDW